MTRPLSERKQNDMFSLLQNGSSVRDVANRLHVSKSSVQRFREKHFPDAKFAIGGRPHKMMSKMERSAIINLTTSQISRPTI